MATRKITIPNNDTEKKAPPSCFVYMVRCGDDSLYTGWTTDYTKRLAAHNSGKGAKYTRSRLPVTLVYVEICENKIAAAKREAAIKKKSRDQKLKLISANTNILSS